MEDLLKGLNEAQRASVIYNEGPSLIIAGAGSGKTRVLTYKIAALIKMGLYPSSILALTFTNKAAKEMKSRVMSLMGENAVRGLWIGTFHSMFLRILRAEAETLGYTPDFTIYDTDNTKSLIKTILKEKELDVKVYAPNKVYARISQLKNNLIVPGMYQSLPHLYEEDKLEKMPRMQELYTAYANRCKSANAMDFDDILLKTNILFRDYPQILEKYRNKFKFVLVDEYQDTNFSQHLVVKKLTEISRKLCVVGDDAQSIYSFRGATIRNILDFKKDFPDYKLFKLEQNYRSTQNIVAAANSLIRKNSEQIPKDVFSKNEMGGKLKLISAYSDQEEACLVANAIKELKRIDTESSYNDFAVLYRTNAQSRVLEEEMRRILVPYRIYGSLSFYQRKEIQDILSFLKMAVNQADEVALDRSLGLNFKIGETTIKKLQQAAQNAQQSLWEVTNDPVKYGVPLNKGTIEKLKVYTDLIKRFVEFNATHNAYEVVEKVIAESGILRQYQMEDQTPEIESRIANIQELLSAVYSFVDAKLEVGDESIFLTDFLSEASLATDQDEGEDDKDKITLMTIHASKGLEYKHVFIVGLEEKLFPSKYVRTPQALEEERRLLYVAITRAEKTCTILFSKNRFRNGQVEESRPSRFLNDIGSSFMDVRVNNVAINQNALHKSSFSPRPILSRPTMTSNSSVQSTSSTEIVMKQTDIQVHEGSDIIHEKFGQGKVIQYDSIGGKITVVFENSGTKNLLLKFAKIVVLN